jgi:hypothetical protein
VFSGGLAFPPRGRSERIMTMNTAARHEVIPVRRTRYYEAKGEDKRPLLISLSYINNKFICMFSLLDQECCNPLFTFTPLRVVR